VRTHVVGALAVCAVVLRGAQAQDAAPGARAELVQLDVVVTDAEGKLVEDLTRADFDVQEDGKVQALSHFTLVKSGPGVIAASPAAAPPAAPEAAPVPASAVPVGRHIVIVVDDLHISSAGMEHTRVALRRFMDEVAGANDQIALVTTAAPPVVEQLTSDRATLRAAVNRLKARPAVVAPPRNSQMTAAQAEMILSGDRSALLLAARNLISEPGSVLETTSPQVAVDAPAGAATGPSTDSEAKERLAATMAERQARSLLDEALRFSGATLVAVDDVLRSLAPLAGRKICLLASDGFLVGRGTSEERTREMRRIVDAATRSGAVVYALDTRGLVSTGGDASAVGTTSPGLQTRVDRQGEQLERRSLETLARDTGGFVVHGTNDLAAGLHRMLADSSTYYLMGYAPTNLRRDGRFRRVQVRVPGRKGLTVRTRTGYFEPGGREAPRPAPKPAPGPDAELLRMLEALGAGQPAGPLRVSLAADFLELPPEGARGLIRAWVDLRAVTWRDAPGKHLADLDVLGAVYDSQGRMVGPTFGRQAPLALSDEELERAKADGFGFRHAVALPPGTYEVRLAVRERALDQRGGASARLEVPDLQAGKLAASGLFVSAASDAQTSQLRETDGDRRFHVGETLVFQLYVYNAARDAAGKPDVVLQAQIWSADKPLAASRPQPAALAAKDGIPLPESHSLPLAGLGAGRYELRVVVVDRSAKAELQRRLGFRIE
jgi:VWFA-related protein